MNCDEMTTASTPDSKHRTSVSEAVILGEEINILNTTM